MKKNLLQRNSSWSKAIIGALVLFGLSFSNVNAKDLSITSGIITFQSKTSGTIFGSDNIATAGEGGSTAIAGITIQIYAIGADNNAALTTATGDLTYRSVAEGYGQEQLTFNGQITPQKTQGEFYGLLVRSSDGSNFKLTSLNFVDWGSWLGESWTIEAFDNGVSKGSAKFNGATNGDFVALTHSSILTNAFNDIDEVRIHKTDNTDGWIGINNIGIEAPATVTAINDNILAGTTELYPNPASSNLTIVVPAASFDNNTSVTLYNTLGETVFVQTLTNSKTEINLTNLPSGVYSVKINSRSGASVQKIIKY